MDPLGLLRDYFVRKELDKVKHVGDELLFEDDQARFPASMETGYKRRTGGYYTLDALFFFAQNAYLPFADYTRLAVQNKIPNITFLDRTGIIEYLEGKVQTNDRIDSIVMVIPSRQAPPTLGKRREEEDLEALRSEEAGPLAKKQRAAEEEAGVSLAAEDVEFKRIMERERPVRDREHLLLCHRKSFESILKKLSSSSVDPRSADGRSGGGGSHGKEPAATKPAPVQALPPPPGAAGRYAEVGQKQYWKGYLQSDVAEELNIDQYGGTGVQAQPPQAQASKPPGSAPAPPRPGPPRSHHRSSSHGGKGSDAQSKQQDVPIILVPNAVKTPLNMYNAVEFLEQGKFVFPEEKMHRMAAKPGILSVERWIGRAKKVKYVVCDKLAPNSPDWDRVVAVFVLGKEWQFKDWPGKTPAEILHKYKGVYIHFQNESVDAIKTIKSWNVQILTLHKTQRHKDLQVAREFWESLDIFLNARKSTLVY